MVLAREIMARRFICELTPLTVVQLYCYSIAALAWSRATTCILLRRGQSWFVCCCGTAGARTGWSRAISTVLAITCTPRKPFVSSASTMSTFRSFTMSRSSASTSRLSHPPAPFMSHTLVLMFCFRTFLLTGHDMCMDIMTRRLRVYCLTILLQSPAFGSTRWICRHVPGHVARGQALVCSHDLILGHCAREYYSSCQGERHVGKCEHTSKTPSLCLRCRWYRLSSLV